MQSGLMKLSYSLVYNNLFFYADKKSASAYIYAKADNFLHYEFLFVVIPAHMQASTTVYMSIRCRQDKNAVFLEIH